MHLKRSPSLVGVVGAAAAILIATAGAAPGPAKPTPKLRFTSSAAVIKYLKSHGINTRGIVVQRGVRNYAGTHCPGKAWNCTKARRVIQFATLASTFQCSPSNAPGGSATSPNDCTVVQVNTTGDNNAKCNEPTSTTIPSPSQHCNITQTNVSGKNNATVTQVITQTSGQQQNGTQDANVNQQNGTGSNNSLVTQTIWQTTSTNGPAVNQDQDGTQTNTITQNSGTGAQLSVMSQLTVQKATAGREHDDDDDDDDHPDYTYPGPSPFTGTQDQYGDGQSHTDQTSNGVSKSYNFQNMLQIEKAPRYSGVIQSQNGPYRCCTSPGQGTNPNDVFQLQQAKLQFRSYGFAGSAGNQFASETGLLESSGHSHVSQFINQNGTTDSNSCDANGGVCAAILTVNNGTTVTKCNDAESCDISPPGPPPPPPGPLFVPSSHAPR